MARVVLVQDDAFAVKHRKSLPKSDLVTQAKSSSMWNLVQVKVEGIRDASEKLDEYLRAWTLEQYSNEYLAPSVVRRFTAKSAASIDKNDGCQCRHRPPGVQAFGTGEDFGAVHGFVDGATHAPNGRAARWWDVPLRGHVPAGSYGGPGRPPDGRRHGRRHHDGRGTRVG